MAWHDDRKRIPSERLSHSSCRAWRAEPRGDFAVRQRAARRARASDLIDATMKRGNAIHVEGDVGEIAVFASHERANAVESSLDFRRGRRLFCTGKSGEQARTGGRLTRFGELHRDDAALTPANRAAADRCVEEFKTARHPHDPQRS